MKIALFGATGTIGQRIAKEALSRGHLVTAIVRDPSRLPFTHPSLSIVQGDVLDPASVGRSVAGHDVVISAIGPTPEKTPNLTDAAHSLINGVSRAGIERLIVVGGAGSLEVAPGVQLVDTPDFHEAWKPVALAHRDALDVYRQSNINWTY